uniref:Thioredoxin domain-containing protein n=1 Tax=Globisporangium ultimum (strain ATCC 200006 / CBS 805.95 / DAOM BR144) TaxID=431595 RepID=K3WAL0_GLOUD
MSESVLKGVELINAKGETVQGDDVTKSGALAFYFAADWCPDCRGFQPTLNKFYERVNAGSKRLELVFVSSDGSQEAQAAHLKDKQGPWWSIPFESPLRNEFKRKYAVAAGKELAEVGLTTRKAGIPGLVVVQPNGDVIKLFDDSELAGDGLKELEQLL